MNSFTGHIEGAEASVSTDAPARVAYLCLQATREGQASHAHVHEIVNGLRRRGWRLELFEPSYAGEAKEISVLTKLCAFFLVQCRLWRRVGSWDVLYVRAHPAALPTAVLAWLLGMPVIQEVNGPYQELFTVFPAARWGRPLIAAISLVPLRLATRVVVVTPQLREYVTRAVGTKLCNVIPNGANVDHFRPDVSKFPGAPAQYVVFFGALAKWQGLPELLQAVAEPDWPAEVCLLIAGNGTERPSVIEAAARSPQIRYMGNVPYRLMPNLIAHSIAGLSPKSNVSGHRDTGLSPLKVYETLACGVPVVVSDLPGPRELVERHRCGVVVPERSPGAIARAVAQLFVQREESRAMGERGRQAIVCGHSWEQRVADTAAELCSALGRVRHD